MTRTIGLTGGIGSGKSTVARLLEKLGARVIDADAIVHELEGPGQSLTAEIAASFGSHLLRPDGAVDREALGALVFRDAAARRRGRRGHRAPRDRPHHRVATGASQSSRRSRP